ncbi:glutaminyl-peptide cyclotransferase [Thiobacter aerophilum]|uniref:Glutaminyl-peptide cyclotransferase n=1 Tax=Thiobacter aerophilum TaxID=3121275 RepID=A0ABV0EJI3_9BURK
MLSVLSRAAILIWLLAGSGPVLAQAPVVSPRVLASLPHDRHAFTQGLLWHAGALYESTGGYGGSSLRRVDPQSGRVLAVRWLAPTLFGEGLARVGGALFQLTWKENRLLVYDAASLALVRTLSYPYEGWGATWNGRHLIVSDGSSRLRFLEPDTLALRRTLVVRDGTTPVAMLNELEWASGELLANVYGKPRIARIDPASGRLRGWLDLSPLVPRETRADPEAVANGIAYDPRRHVLYVTGKRWPVLFKLAWPES